MIVLFQGSYMSYTKLENQEPFAKAIMLCGPYNEGDDDE